MNSKEAVSTPKRVRYRRGAALSPGVVYVGRPTRWGNPWRIGDEIPGTGGDTYDRAGVVEMFRLAANTYWGPEWRAEVRAELGGHDLACWCPLDKDCHADILLAIANQGL